MPWRSLLHPHLLLQMILRLWAMQCCHDNIILSSNINITSMLQSVVLIIKSVKLKLVQYIYCNTGLIMNH